MPVTANYVDGSAKPGLIERALPGWRTIFDRCLEAAPVLLSVHGWDPRDHSAVSSL